MDEQEMINLCRKGQRAVLTSKDGEHRLPMMVLDPWGGRRTREAWNKLDLPTIVEFQGRRILVLPEKDENIDGIILGYEEARDDRANDFHPEHPPRYAANANCRRHGVAPLHD